MPVQTLQLRAGFDEDVNDMVVPVVGRNVQRCRAVEMSREVDQIMSCSPGSAVSRVGGGQEVSCSRGLAEGRCYV